MDTLFQNLSFRRLAILWLPTFLRKNIMSQLLSVILRPIELMYIDFLRLRQQNLIRINYTYQKFSLQRRLNERFDPMLKRIKIVNAVQYEGVYLYTEAESGPMMTKHQWLHDNNNPIYLRTEAELTSEYDFIVQIPNSNINQIQLAAEVDYYKLIGKNYKIVII